MIPLHTIHEAPHITSHPPLPPKRLWWDMFLYSIILVVGISLYYFAVDGTYTLKTVNRVFADISIILIGLSMALSGLCYFWNFADKYIIYRKELGVIGLVYALVHGAIVLTSTSIPTLFSLSPIGFSSAVAAIIIYICMVLITNTVLFTLLGGHTWRILMRLGYVGLLLSLVHTATKAYPLWIAWFSGSSSVFPPFGLLTFLLGCSVIVLRIALFIAQYKKLADNSPLPLPTKA